MAGLLKGWRTREIILAIGAGALGAGGAALTLAAIHDDDGTVAPASGGSGRLTYQVAPFDQIATVGPQDVEITQGDTISVRAEGPPRALAQLEVAVEDGKLVIRPKDGSFWNNWGMMEAPKFHVTVPRLSAISLLGSGDIHADRIDGDSFTGNVGGSGEIAIDQLTVDRAELKVAGSGDFSAKGTAREAHVSIAGSGDIQAGGLHARDGSVSIAGSGDAALNVDNDAQVTIFGSGDVDISGSGHCTVKRTGSGDVRCEGGGGDE